MAATDEGMKQILHSNDDYQCNRPSLLTLQSMLLAGWFWGPPEL